MDTRIRLAVHVFLGAALGFLLSCVFLLLYYGMSYTMPVTNAVRFRFAFWDTVMLSLGIFVVMFWHDFRTYLDKYSPADEDEDEAQ